MNTKPQRKKSSPANGKKNGAKFEPSKEPCRALSPGGNGVKLSCESDQGHEDKIHSATIEREGKRVIRRWQGRKWLEDIEIEGDGTKTLTTEVNGKPAQLVLDGKTGTVLEGEEDAPNGDVFHDLLKRLAIVNGELIVAERAKKAAAEDHKSVQTRQNNIVSELVRLANGEQMLPGLSPVLDTLGDTESPAPAEERENPKFDKMAKDILSSGGEEDDDDDDGGEVDALAKLNGSRSLGRGVSIESDGEGPEQ